MTRLYINVEKESLITLRDGLGLLLSKVTMKNQSLYSDCKYELEQIDKELKLR